jgi:acetyl esterase
VASLDYRRAPEHKHPAALEDALFAYRWLLDNAQSIGGDASRIALFGESSGAATVACLTILLRDLGAAQPVLQILAYPITDAGERWLSYEEHGEGYTLDRQFVRWSLENYLPAGHDAIDPYFLPMTCENLSGLAPSLVVTAEFDPLRDQGVAYARRLSAAGVAVEHLHVEDQPHGFLLLDRAVARAGVLIDRLADSLAAQCSTPRAPATTLS